MVLERLCREHGIVMPRVSYDLRGRCAGVSYNDKNWINFNIFLFRENFTDFLENVVPHELCHAWMDQLKLKGRAHGKEWKELMGRMGIPALRCHNYCIDYSVSRTGLFRYQCACPGAAGGHMVGLELHREIQAEPELYRCERCKVGFVYIPQERAVRRVFDRRRGFARGAGVRRRAL